VSALRTGLRTAAGNARLLWWLLAANLALAFVAASPLMGPFEESLSRHEAAAEMTRRFDMSWWVDLTTSRAESFSRALDAVAAAAFLSAILGCFFAGGLLQAYHDTMGELPLDRFMTSCRRWFGRFVWLFALSLPLYWLVHRLVNTHLALAIDDALEHVKREEAGLLINLGRAALFLILFDLVTLMADYARVHAIVRAERSMLTCLSSGMRFVLRHPLRVGSLEAAALGAQALALGLYVPVDRLLTRESATGLVAGLIATESFLLLRLFLRETTRAGQVALYRSVAAG
jgi:hypothetical protein